MKRILALMLAVLMLMSTVSAMSEARGVINGTMGTGGTEGIDWGYDDEGNIVLYTKPTDVTLADSGTVKAYIGTPLTLGVTVTPVDAMEKLLKWSSSSTKIATVADGVVSGLKEGTVTITVKTPDGKKKDTVKVQVLDPLKPSAVVLAESGTLELEMGNVLQLNATVEPETAEAAISWKSSSTKVATVENGVVTPVGTGTATITVTAKYGKTSKTDTVKVKVTDACKPTKIELAESGTIQLALGETLELHAAMQPAEAKSAAQWSSSSTKIAKVENGVVTPVKEGTATITVKTYNGKKDTVKVQVFDPKKPQSVTLAESGTVQVALGSRLQLNASVYPDTADKALKWSSSSTKIATVVDGVVKPVKEGTVTITVQTVNGKKDTVKVQVFDPKKPQSVTLSESGTVTLDIDKTLNLNAAVLPDTAVVDLKWSSSSAKIATVADGVVTPVGEGTATITVKTHNGKSDTVKVKVVDPYKPTKVELAETGTVTLDIDKTLKLNATLQPATAKSELTYKSSNPKIVKVGENNELIPLKEGTVTITVRTRNGKTDTVKVKVVDPYKPTKVELEYDGSAVLEKGQTLQLNVKLYPENARTELKWTTSNSKVATVSADGVVTCHSKGKVSISVATANGKKASVSVKGVGELMPVPGASNDLLGFLGRPLSELEAFVGRMTPYRNTNYIYELPNEISCWTSDGYSSKGWPSGRIIYLDMDDHAGVAGTYTKTYTLAGYNEACTKRYTEVTAELQSKGWKVRSESWSMSDVYAVWYEKTVYDRETGDEIALSLGIEYLGKGPIYSVQANATLKK